VGLVVGWLVVSDCNECQILDAFWEEVRGVFILRWRTGRRRTGTDMHGRFFDLCRKSAGCSDEDKEGRVFACWIAVFVR
jgi:hypothetical protein